MTPVGEDLARLLSDHRAPRAAVVASRMRRDRHARLQTEMARQGVDVALFLHGPNVAYATGHPVRGVDVSVAVHERPVGLVVAGHDQPHLLWDGRSTDRDDDAGLDVEHHPAVWLELDEGAAALAQALVEIAGPELMGGRVAVDELTGAMVRQGVLDGATVHDASHLIGAAKLVKTGDELGCIAEAQRRNEVAMVATQAAVRPGVTRSAVAGEFLAQLCSLGVEANLIDPIIQRMPRSIADGPRTTTGHVAFPLGAGAGDPVLAHGDLVWVDTGIDHLGYASDFGRTWIVGRDPRPAEHELFERWGDVMAAVLAVLRPGVSAGDLVRVATAANGGVRPWLPQFYLAHGVGVESAEMPLVGTDLGPEFDDGLVLAPGMVLVLEPVIWEDGVGGYRAEEIVAVTTDGWSHLGSGHGYLPFTADTLATSSPPGSPGQAGPADAAGTRGASGTPGATALPDTPGTPRTPGGPGPADAAGVPGSTGPSGRPGASMAWPVGGSSDAG